jgi:hypothetical protein
MNADAVLQMGVADVDALVDVLVENGIESGALNMKLASIAKSVALTYGSRARDVFDREARKVLGQHVGAALHACRSESEVQEVRRAASGLRRLSRQIDALMSKKYQMEVRA